MTVIRLAQIQLAMIINIDRKLRSIQLSIKAKDEAETAEALAEYNKSAAEASTGTTSLGALLRAKLDNSDK